MTGRRRLATSMVVALVLVFASVALRALEARGTIGADRPASELLPILFALAGLCVAGLLRHRSPAWAWAATATTAALAALQILGSVRGMAPAAGGAMWSLPVVVAAGAIIAAAAAGGAYATHRPSGGRSRSPTAWPVIVLAGLVAVVLVMGWAVVEAFGVFPQGLAAGPPPDDLPPLRGSARLAAVFIAMTLVAGAWRDVAEPLRRARSRAGTLRDLPRAIGEELLPGLSAARRSGRDEERARLAAELHALVLPDLRRAARAAEAAASSGHTTSPVAADLRQAVQDVELLMHERQSVVLEEFGLVAALEWLAERTQERGGIEVRLELDGGDVGDPSAVSKPVGRAAFRVALLALDNVVRHAQAATALVRLSVDHDRLRLAVVDHGRGPADEASDRGGRGLSDMRAAAAEIAGTLRVERLEGGTEVVLDWRAPAGVAEHPAVPDVETTDRRAALEG